MLPILMDTSDQPILLIGDGRPAESRLAFLDGAGADVRVFAGTPSEALREAAGDRLVAGDPDARDFEAAAMVFIAGLPDDVSKVWYDKAKAAGALVNVEDVKPLCDFHVPSLLRRGDLTVTISTGGKSPGLARRLRRYLEDLLPPVWSERLDEIADLRNGWRAEGASLAEVSKRTDAFIDKQGWLR